MCVTEHEITTPRRLCDAQGKLLPTSIGYARHPLIEGNVSGHFLRKKQWNYWCVFGQEALFSATISHLDYASVCFIYTLDYQTKEFFEQTVVVPFDRKLKMPSAVHATIEAIHPQLGIFFNALPNQMEIHASSPQFNGQPLRADVSIHYPSQLETLQVVIPWTNNKFQYTAKHHCLPVEGKLVLGEREYTFSKETDFAVLDYGRGIWPRSSTWNWGMASGKQGDDIIGLNFGGQWTDGTGGTENAVWLNGHMTKISESVTFTFDPTNRMKPWTIHSSSCSVQLTFTPFFERIAATSVVVVRSEVHQMVGHYHGKITLPTGQVLYIHHLLGTIEDHDATW